MSSLAGLLILALSAGVQAVEPGDGVVVHFKDGAAVPGVLAELSAAEVTLEVPGGRMGWPMHSVDRLEPRRTDLETYKELEADLGADEGRIRSLARWAQDRGLHTYSNRLAREAGMALPVTQAAPPVRSAAPEEGQAPAPRNEPSAPEAARASCPAAEPSRPAADDSPAMGFGGPGPSISRTGPYPYAYTRVIYVPVLASPPRRLTPEEQERFLREQEARREAYRRRTDKSLLMDWQFRFQEALDRHAHGLSFESEPF